MALNTNEKGNIGLLKVIEDLYNRNCHVFLPFDDYSPIDLVAITNSGKVLRLQVKYRQPMSSVIEERYELLASSVVNGVKIPINKNLIDGWALYMPNKNKVKYIPISSIGDKKSMRIDPNMEYGNIFGEDSQ